MSLISKSFLELVPAYGRDYKSVKAVQADWEANKDFIIATLAYGNKPASRQDFVKGTKVNIRYARLTKVCVLTA